MGAAKTRDQRAQRVADAMHSSEMEGLTVGAATRADADLYVEGAIDSDELVARTRARYGLPAEAVATTGRERAQTIAPEVG
ncbi:Putative uncharacterized protein [Propionibacterium freudenreichii subsp. freudenreichii]|uniref:Antitoxin VbhA domain-containing protein n=1 Tax=Propionibacterium freudenreichii subsp. freudenreichii TaxID=66712 RepID=A0A0B7NX76_PROFF|nr:antitoxin VbhA family protein [Propionibacterium freudenreichii]MDK9322384.1 antitoxin VbhA family protein [Propionibacterium freudenreichii]CEI30267.1 Protein of unknown function [Propionibacterium freudenreichii]CEP25559.1 Putative uncharacterized protein [Propionibacterium freudenreichii subsp. freudenreichii]